MFFTNVKPHDETMYTPVWRLDGNLHYLHGKHTILFVVSGVAGVVALLYALILTFIQCLRRAPNSRMCGWVGTKTQTSTGCLHWSLLLVRIALFTSFAANFENNPTLNFTLIIAVASLLIIGIQTGIYRNRFIGILESSMYVNLILFSAFTMLSMKSGPSQKTVVVCVFSGWALLAIVGIVLYHGYKNCFGDAMLNHVQVLFNARLRAHDPNTPAVRPLVIGGNSNVSEESDSEPET